MALRAVSGTLTVLCLLLRSGRLLTALASLDFYLPNLSVLFYKFFRLFTYIVAYISLSTNDFHGYPYIQFLCVESERRRTGIGNKLMDFVERRFVERRVFISTESGNEPMLNLLKKRGFQLSGKLHGLNKDDSDEVFFFKDIKVVEE